MNEPGFNLSRSSLESAVVAAARTIRDTKNLNLPWKSRVRAAVVDAAYELTKEKDEAILEARKRLADTNSLMQDDLSDLLRALGLSDAARPQSPHTVMQEAIKEAGELRQDLTRTERSRHEIERRLDEIHYRLKNHFSPITDICQDRGVKWPCHVARAFGYE